MNKKYLIVFKAENESKGLNAPLEIIVTDLEWHYKSVYFKREDGSMDYAKDSQIAEIKFL